MKIIKINISKSAIFKDVSLNTAYAEAGNASDSNRIQTIDDDKSYLDRAFSEIVGWITDRLRQFLQDYKSIDGDVQFILEVSGSYDDSLTSTVESDLREAIAAGVTAAWFRFTCPSLVKEWQELRETILNRVISKLCYRKKPVRLPH